MTGEPSHPRRRLTDQAGPADTPRARQGRLVRYIAADPALTAWLGTTKARTLHAVAADLVAAGHDDAAEMVSRRARDLADGTASPF